MLTLDFDVLDLRRGNTVLDLGCGAGRHSFEALKRGANVVAADLNVGVLAAVARMVAAMRGEGEIPAGTSFVALRADALALPFRSGSFDRVIASEVLEHIPRDETAMAEIARVLKPGGRAAVTVPRWWPERICWALSDEYHRSAGGHVRIYRAAELQAKLARTGLVPRHAHHAHALHAPYWWLKCAAGVDRTDARLPRAYHRFLVWQLVNQPRSLDALEHLLNPLLGKSRVVYADKSERTPG